MQVIPEVKIDFKWEEVTSRLNVADFRGIVRRWSIAGSPLCFVLLDRDFPRLGRK
jgi:hypothetical protein